MTMPELEADLPTATEAERDPPALQVRFKTINRQLHLFLPPSGK